MALQAKHIDKTHSSATKMYMKQNGGEMPYVNGTVNVNGTTSQKGDAAKIT